MDYDDMLDDGVVSMDDNQVGGSPCISMSVVIPTKDRVRECEDLFVALKEAVDYAMNCEVIVVDDSRSAESETIKNFCQSHGFIFISTDEHSVARKRNLGWKAARGKFVLFLDSDCLPEKDLIKRHLENYSKNVSSGCLGDLYFFGPRNIFFRAAEITPFVRPFQFARKFVSTTWGPTANISFKKSELERVRGFDPTFPDRPGGEDVDLGLRITADNQPIACNASARVGHSTSTWNTYSKNMKRFFGWGRADYHLIVKQPHRTMFDLPRIPITFGLLVTLCMVLTIVKLDPHFLAIPFVWLMTTVGISAIFYHLEGGNPSYKERLIALTYILANEVGTLYEGFSYKYWRIVFKRMNYGDGQIYGEWHEAGKRLWAQWIALAICVWLY